MAAVPAWIWRDLFAEGKGWAAFFKDITFFSFFFEQTRWFWYILMIGICYWLCPYIYNMIETAADRISEKMRVLMICTLSTVFLMALSLYHKELYVNVSIAISRVPAFVIGVLIGKAVYEKRTMLKKGIGVTLVLAIIIAWPLQMVGKSILGVYANAFLNYAFSLIFVFILVSLSGGKRWAVGIHNTVTAVLGWFGKYTLELYMIHVVVRRIMNTSGYYTYRLSNELLMAGISIMLSVVLNRAAGLIQKKISQRPHSVAV